MSVFRSDRAGEDIASALGYLGQRSVTAAERLSDQLEEKCRLLAANPFVGRIRDEIAPGLRSVIVGNYVLLYTVIGDGEVIIVRFIYGRRNLIAAFNDPP